MPAGLEKQLRTRKTELADQIRNNLTFSKIPPDVIKKAIDFWNVKGLLITREWSSLTMIPYSVRGLSIGMGRYRDIYSAVMRITDYTENDDSANIKVEYLVVLFMMQKEYRKRCNELKAAIRDIYSALLSQGSLFRPTDKELDVMDNASKFLGMATYDPDKPPF